MVLFALSSAAYSQEPAEPTVLALPECDIFVFDLVESDDAITISNPRNITSRPGYDNQPWFTPASESILYSANGKPDRTDVFEYFLESGDTRQVTDSADQEYSPQISPDNRTLSFVTDGSTANQSVWKMERDAENSDWLLQNQGEREPVGYYSWNHETGFILYWSRYGYCLRLAHEDRGPARYISGNAPPSTPHIIPGSNKFSFLHRQGNQEVWIKELDPETLAVRPLVAMQGSNLNYAWTPAGKVVMADGTRLLYWSPDVDGWQSACDLADFELQGVTRVAVSPNGKSIAIVALPVDP